MKDLDFKLTAHTKAFSMLIRRAKLSFIIQMKHEADVSMVSKKKKKTRGRIVTQIRPPLRTDAETENHCSSPV